MSIRWKLLGSYLLLVGLLISFFSGLLLKNVMDRSLENRSTLLLDSAQIIAAELAPRMLQQEYIQLIAEQASEQHQFRILVFDQQKKLLGDSGREKELLNRSWDYQELDYSLRGERFWRVHELAEQTVIYASVPIKERDAVTGAVLLSAPIQDIEKLMDEVRNRMMWIGLIFLLLTAGLSYGLSRSISRPVIKIAEAAAEIGQGDYGKLVTESGGDEIAQLARSFNEMSRKLQQLEKNRRKFFHNASHELKSPLASAAVMVDAVLMDLEAGRTPTLEFLAEVRAQLLRLQRLTERISHLARLDELLLVQLVPLDLGQLMERITSTMNPLALRHELKLEVNLPEAAVMVEGDADLLGEALINLIDNAVKYTDPGGRVDVCLTHGSDHAVIKVADTGIGILEQDQDYIFERFYRGEGQAAKREGSGLGLSIAGEIIKIHHGLLELCSRPGQGTVVKVKLPLSQKQKA